MTDIGNIKENLIKAMGEENFKYAQINFTPNGFSNAAIDAMSGHIDKLTEMLMNQECLINVLKKENADLKESTIESKLNHAYKDEILSTDQVLNNITNILEFHQKQTGTKVMSLTINWDSTTATLRSQEQPFILDIDANINK